MDLIDRSKIDFYKLTGPELVSAIEEAPSVPAVPLDKLCEWLARFGIPIPCDLCNYDDTKCWETPDYCPNSAEDWREALTKVLDDDLPILNERR